jgi:glycosyltransferase involved in cell wall biosynthesis
LISALGRLLDSPARRQWLGTAGRRRALDVFSWESVAAQTVRVYERAIARSTPVDDSNQVVGDPC